jgi:carboxypeptidase Q
LELNMFSRSPLLLLWSWLLVFGFGSDSWGQGSSGPIAEAYRPIAKQIIEAAHQQNDSLRKLEELCDGIGHRLSGSDSLNRAIDWAQAVMKADGQENVRAEKVMVTKWVRGNESCELVEPRSEPIAMLGLGGSVGTPAGGITAEVLVVQSKEELEALPAEKVAGKIVVFNAAMPKYTPENGSGYGTAVQYRGNGAKWAAEKGAVAALVRSITAISLNTPHTGAMRYGDAKQQIPVAAITIEAAMMLQRLQDRGVTPKVKLSMESRTEGEAPSANVLAEIVGRKKSSSLAGTSTRGRSAKAHTTMGPVAWLQWKR